MWGELLFKTNGNDDYIDFIKGTSIFLVVDSQ